MPLKFNTPGAFIAKKATVGFFTFYTSVPYLEMGLHQGKLQITICWKGTNQPFEEDVRIWAEAGPLMEVFQRVRDGKLSTVGALALILMRCPEARSALHAPG